MDFINLKTTSAFKNVHVQVTYNPYSFNCVSKLGNKDIWELKKVSNKYILSQQILIKSIPECMSPCLSKFVCYSKTDLSLNSHVLKSFMPIVEDHYHCRD